MASILDRADGSRTPRHYVPALLPVRDLPLLFGAALLVALAFALALFPETVAGFLRFLADQISGGV